MFCVYLIQNLIDKKVYVGKSAKPAKRFQQHVATSKRGITVGRKTFSLLHKAIAKYGISNFRFNVLEEFESESDALDAEKFWIEFLRSDVIRFGPDYGYNLTAGGDGLSGGRHSVDSKQKISQALRGKKKPPMSKEHKEKIVGNLIYAKNVGTKIHWPSDFELVAEVNSVGFLATARRLGVTDNAVRGRLHRRNLLAGITRSRSDYYNRKSKSADVVER